MRNLLSNTALAQLAVFERTKEIDTTEELFTEMFELTANDMDSEVREDEDRMLDAVMRRIAAL
jgi:hypothetical protein